MGYFADKPTEKRNIFCFDFKLVYKSNKAQFLWVYRRNKLLGMRLVIYKFFSQHPAWFITLASKPIETAVYGKKEKVGLKI